MIQNRIVTVESNVVNLHINHTENGEVYKLKEGEKYQIVISPDGTPGSMMKKVESDSPDCTFTVDIPEGIYCLEICLVRNGQFQVILPAVDERHRTLNQVIVLGRVSFA